MITHYENQMYRLTTDIGYSFHKLYDYDANVYYLIYANNLFWNFQYPVFLVGNWSSSILLNNTLSIRSLTNKEKDQYKILFESNRQHKEYRQLLEQESFVNLFKWQAGWNLTYGQQDPLQKYSHQFFQLQLAGEYSIVAENHPCMISNGQPLLIPTFTWVMIFIYLLL